MFSFFVSLSFSAKRALDKFGRPFLPQCEPLYYENFSDPFVKKRWFASRNISCDGKWENEQTYPLQGRPGEKGMIVKSKQKTSIISTLFPAPIYTPNETIVIQYETRAQLVYTCFSSIMRIYTSEFDVYHQTNYTNQFLEFGPDYCKGLHNARLNFFTKDESAKTITHKLKANITVPGDEIPHLYTLIIRPNNTFEYMIDTMSFYNGTFTGSFTPNFVEPEFIDDPNDHKPSDWEDNEFIPDLTATKPNDWNESEPEMIPNPRVRRPPLGWRLHEPEMIPDPKAQKPEEWNDRIHGQWKPKMIPNPKCKIGCGPWKPPLIKNKKYKGKWSPPLIRNPKFKGIWKPKQIPNPNYKPVGNFEMPPIYGIGFSVWSYYHDVAITNIMIANNESLIKRWNLEDFAHRQRIQIKKMKLAYNWINIDEEIDIPPEPGLMSHLKYYGGKVSRRWSKVENKPAIITIVVALILLIVPVSYIIYELISDEPFKLKTE